MASEPAEPTTRPQDDVIEKAARAMFVRQLCDRQTVTVKYLGWQVDAWRDEPVDGKAEYRADARALADAGLLADPAQTTELERLRARITQYQAELDKARSERASAVATSEAWKQERDDLEAEAQRHMARVRDALGTQRGRAVSVHAAEVRAERDALQGRVTAQEQTLEIVCAQTDDCVEQVDAALGHRYHTPGVHYSVPHVAEKAAAELKQLQDRIDAVRRWLDDPQELTHIGQLHQIRVALQGDRP